MKQNMNSMTGVLAIYLLGGASASFPASFVLKGNYDIVGGSIFLIIGAVCLALGAILYLVNRNADTNPTNNMSQFTIMLLTLTTLTGVVMFILGNTVRFY